MRKTLSVQEFTTAFESLNAIYDRCVANASEPDTSENFRKKWSKRRNKVHAFVRIMEKCHADMVMNGMDQIDATKLNNRLDGVLGHRHMDRPSDQTFRNKDDNGVVMDAHLAIHRLLHSSYKINNPEVKE